MPCPFWVLRHHSPSPVHHLCVDSHRHLVIAGDAQGRVSVTHLRHYRPIAFWQAHTESILGVHLSQNLALTHGRDNRLVLWRLPRRDEDQEGGEHGHNAQHVKGQERIVGDAPPSSIMPTRLSSSLETPALLKEIEVNALNFARFSLLATPLDAAQLPKLAAAECLVAVPHTLDAAWFDVFDLPSGRRVHEAVSKPDIVAKPGSRQPIIMSLHLIRLPTQTGEDLACVAGYEDGYVRLWQHSEARTWTLTWERRVHSESVMDVALSEDRQWGVSVSADDRISRFSVADATAPPLIKETGHPGRAAVSIRNDGRLVAVAGWDGRIRIYATDTLAELGSLRYHRDTVESLAFFESSDDGADASCSDDESDKSSYGCADTSQRTPTASSQSKSALAASGRDGKISLWRIY